eukprot:11057-Heterococcus_DN1.PRE.2
MKFKLLGVTDRRRALECIGCYCWVRLCNTAQCSTAAAIGAAGSSSASASAAAVTTAAADIGVFRQHLCGEQQDHQRVRVAGCDCAVGERSGPKPGMPP